MSDSLDGKRALVTGASKGIGLAVAEALAREGVEVAICARKDAELRRALQVLKETAPQTKTTGCVADVSKAADVSALFAFVDRELGGVDILVNNAGLGIFRPAAELTIEEWDTMIGTNLSGAFYCSQSALTRFRHTGGGFIINISSLAGKNPFAGGSGYNASKFGMNGFSEAMMLDHRNDNVRVSYIMPGSVDTEFSGQDSQERSDWKISPGDIAEIVLNILKMPSRTLISRVEVRPSRPRKN
jgi:NAD(P)-dependent dehydrogenase (short-subunit alcohol dehydrogenase family)